MELKKILAGTLSAAMLVSGNAFAISTSDFSDFPNDWSTKALTNAVENGLLQGKDGKIDASGLLTRAQMATIMNRAFEANKAASLSAYSDVNSSDWFYSEMGKAVQMGLFMGSNGKLSPNNPITRQEAFTVVARAFEMENGSSSALSKFSDSAEVASYAKGSVAALVDGGYVNGSNGKINPKASITRAEFAQIMLNLVDCYVSESGEITKDINGNLVVSAGDVTLKGITIKGDLIIADGVGAGTVTLDSVTITGRIVIRGNANVVIKNSSVSKDVIVSENSSNVKVTVEDGSKIKNIETNGPNTSISGSGSVENVNAGADNVSVTTPNTVVTIDNDASGVTAGGVPVKDGQTATINKDGTDATIVDTNITDPSTPTTDKPSGGSSSGSSSSKKTYTAKTWSELREAFDKASSGDTVRLSDDITDAGVDSNTYDGVSSATATMEKKNVTFDGNGKTVSAAAGKTFCFNIDGMAATATGIKVKNLTVDGGSFSAKLGGAFFVQDGAEVTFDGVTFKNCTAASNSALTGGGAIFMNDHGAAGTTATVQSCVFENNTAGSTGQGRGGAIYANDFRSNAMKLTVKNSTFNGNTAAYGGAIAADGLVDLAVTDCTFESNTATYADDVYIFDGVSEGKKSMLIQSTVTIGEFANNTYTNMAESDSDFSQMNNIFGRYYDARCTVTPHEAITNTDIKDLTFADLARTTLLDTASAVEMTPVTVNGVTYYYGKNLKYAAGDVSEFTVNGSPVSGATKVDSAGTLYKYSASPLTGTLYGTAPMTYKEYYYGELNTSTASGTAANASLSNPSASLKGYDAVTSATSQNGSHSAHYPTILNYTAGSADYASNAASQMKIDGIKTVDVSVNAELYANALILKEAGIASPVGTSASAITIESAKPATAKELLADGSYAKETAVNGGAAKTDYFAGASITPSVAYTSRYGDYQFTFTFADGSLDASSYTDYLMNMYAATISDGTNTAGMLYYQDVWEETSHRYWIDICVSKGDVAAGGGFTASRFDSFFTDDDTMRPGTYTITLKSRGYEDVTATFQVGTKLSESQTLSVSSPTWNTTTGAAATVDTSKLPTGFSADSFTLTKGSGRNAVKLSEGTDYTYANGTITINSTENTGIGAYTFTLTDNDFQAASASFTVMHGMAADQISFVGNTLTIASETGVTLDEYLGALSSVKIDGKTVSAPRGTALKDYLFNADGSLKFDAANGGTAVFANGAAGTYKIEISATAYPSVSGMVGATDLSSWVYAGGFESYTNYMNDSALDAAWNAAAESDMAAQYGITNATALKAFWSGMCATTTSTQTTEIASFEVDSDKTTIHLKDANGNDVASHAYKIVDAVNHGLEGEITYILKTDDTDAGEFTYIGSLMPGVESDVTHFHFRYASTAEALDLENGENMWYPTMINADATTQQKIDLILFMHGVGDVQLPTTVNTEATVDASTGPYVSGSYSAKVTVVFDAEGKVISVSDNGTDAEDNASWWSKLSDTFWDSFVGKTYSEIDGIDAVSGATVSSNAVKTAVKDALSD